MARAAPERMPAAVEELLRYAGIVRSLRRRATAPVAIGQAAIAPGDLVVLRTETANRDPVKFRIPDRLDIARKPSGNLGLGVGAHACPGAAIVRHVLAVTTPVFLAAHPRLDPDREVTWKGDPTISSPAVISVFLEKQPACPPVPSPAPDRTRRTGELVTGNSDPGAGTKEFVAPPIRTS
jgi:cytochrome P450